MEYRRYDRARDLDAARRIWRETGWLDAGKAGAEEAFDVFASAGPAWVAEVGGEAECLVLTAPGHIKYLAADLPFSCVTGVTTSRVARKQGLASGLTAAAVAAAAVDGAAVAGLGMFEQGYYDRLGFATGGYEHIFSFDPSRLRVGARPRTPRRLDKNDWQSAHAGRLARWRGHGGCNLTPAAVTRAGMAWSENGFGLGYADPASGELTHHLWCSAKNVEVGPYDVCWLAYREPSQLLELLALVRGLGDQVRLVEIREPAGIQLQDLLREPFRERQVTERSRFESNIRASAYWQMRICDVRRCVAAITTDGADVAFNLTLSDPLVAAFGERERWRGVAGDYVVTLGRQSAAEPGRERGLPRLDASVGALTRLWLGVKPASSLALTDNIKGDWALLKQIDWALRIPSPAPDWDF